MAENVHAERVTKTARDHEHGVSRIRGGFTPATSQWINKTAPARPISSPEHAVAGICMPKHQKPTSKVNRTRY